MTLTKKGFRQWLESLPEGYVFDGWYNNESCPLSKYLGLDGEPHSVFGDGCIDNLLDPIGWVAKFVDNIDWFRSMKAINAGSDVPLPLTVMEVIKALK